MPVYNDGPFVRQAIESLTAQTFPDLEIVILDDHSTDESEAICRDLAAGDPRIIYERAPKNEGQCPTYNGTLARARGEYFFWAPAHDAWNASFVASAVRRLDSDPDLVLAYADTTIVDRDGHAKGSARFDLDTQGLGVEPRLSRTIEWLRRVPFLDPIHGLARTSALRRTRLFRNLRGVDHVILLELAREGGFGHIPQPLYLRRLNRLEPRNLAAVNRGYVARLDPANLGRRLRPTYFRMVREMLRAVDDAPVNGRARRRLKRQVLGMASRRYGPQLLMHDGLLVPTRLLLGHRIADALEEGIYTIAARAMRGREGLG